MILRLGGERAGDADALALRRPRAGGKAVAMLRAFEPDQSEQFVDARGHARPSQPSSFGVIAMFSATVMCGNRPIPWNT